MTFVGEAALSLYLDGADVPSAPKGATFTVAVVDPDCRPVGNETVLVLGGSGRSGVIIWPQTGTTRQP